MHHTPTMANCMLTQRPLFLLLCSDAAPVGPAVRDCVSEFRRTHQDNWEQHKQAFTEDQLTDIMNVTAGGSYFA